MSREEAVTLLSGMDGRQRIDALLSLALYDPDWRWVQDQSLSLLHDRDFDVAATAIIALAHLARLHQQLDLQRVLPALAELKADERLAGRVNDALEDIQIYIKEARP
jgi:hypothetical protein